MVSIEPKKIPASDFNKREDLENLVRNKYGLTPDKKENVVIEGSREELYKLQLSKGSIFWGISVVETDAGESPPDQGTPDRGPVMESGINLSEEKQKTLKETKITKKNG